MLNNVSIIIPIAKDETKHQGLLEVLKATEAEVLPISEGITRAKNMNMGADLATRPYLWFLHADSGVTVETFTALERSLADRPDALHYFDLLFDGDGPRGMSINTWGANLRSWVFGTPYGDQGFCISKEQFEVAGCYREDLKAAEDLMLVWQARQAGVKLKRVPSPLLTSARKYHQKGWFYLTWVYQVSWIRMSIPEAIKLMKIKVLGRG